MTEMEGGWLLVSTRNLDPLELRILIKFDGTEVEIMQESNINGMVIREDIINLTIDEVRTLYTFIGDTPEIFDDTPLTELTMSA